MSLSRLSVLSLSLFIGAAAVADAQQACPCIPIAYEWIATPCDTAKCASSSFGDGNKNVIVVPSSSTDFPWIVLRRVPVGSGAVSPDAPFRVDGYESLPVATAMYAAIDPQLRPMLLTVSDGRTLVVARTSAEKRRRTIVH